MIVTLLALSLADAGIIQDSMQHAFYPALLLILVIASLGIPIPEDIPLLAAGVLLKTHPDIATWPVTILIALIGIMTGDLILYRLGHAWGPEVVSHRFVRRLITPALFRKATEKFHRYGTWYCFFGRFFVGVRAVMCMTAGATRFPYWRFFLADCAGALLSIPFFIYLGYWFAGMIPTLRAYLTGVQGILTIVAVVVVVGFLYFEYRKIRKRRRLLSATRAARTKQSLRSLGTEVDSTVSSVLEPQNSTSAESPKSSIPTPADSWPTTTPTAAPSPEAYHKSCRVPPESHARPPAEA